MASASAEVTFDVLAFARATVTVTVPDLTETRGYARVAFVIPYDSHAAVLVTAVVLEDD